MRSRKSGLGAGLVVVMIAGLVSCSGSSSVTISFTQTPPTSLGVGQNAGITATVTNDRTAGGVDWAVTCGLVGACGSFNPTHTSSGQATVYTAPGLIPVGGSVTITATSSAQRGVTSTATVTVTSTASGIQVYFPVAPPSSMGIGTSTALTALSLNDSSNAGVDWTVTCGSSDCGSFSLTHTSGAQFTNYTAPSTVPAGGTVTVKAASTTNSQAFVQATITITN